MVWTITQLEGRLAEVKAARKAGTLDSRTYYRNLLELLVELCASLVDELDKGEAHMLDADIRRQIPLVLMFVEEQIGLFRGREDAR